MVDPQPSLLLSRLTHDARLEIYSHIVLPPFDGCRDYAGLLLSCRQLRTEIDCEATRQLRVYLQNTNKDSSVKSNSEHAADTREGDTDCLEFVAPSTVLGHPVIGVKVPFLLPPVEHDWHCESYPVVGLCGAVYHPSQPESPYQRAARLRGDQKRAYGKQITKLLRPIKPLHKLHLASVDVELVLDESTAARVAGETRLEQELDARRQQTVLGSTVLGRLLDLYMRELGFQGYYSMAGWSDDWAFNITVINVAWSFSAENLNISPKDWIRGSRIRWWRGVSSRASCAPDRRGGTVQVLYNAGSQAQRELSDVKRNKRMQRIRRRIMSSRGIQQESDDEHDAELAQSREKLRRLGVVEGDDPEPDAMERNMEERAAKMEAERELATVI